MRYIRSVIAVWVICCGCFAAHGQISTLSKKTAAQTLLIETLTSKYSDLALAGCILNSDFLFDFSKPIRNNYYIDEADFFLKLHQQDSIRALISSLVIYMDTLPVSRKKILITKMEDWCYLNNTLQLFSNKLALSSEFLMDVLYTIKPFRQIIKKYLPPGFLYVSSLSSTQADLVMISIYNYYARQPAAGQAAIIKELMSKFTY